MLRSSGTARRRSGWRRVLVPLPGWPRSLSGLAKHFINTVKVNLGIGGVVGRGGGGRLTPLDRRRVDPGVTGASGSGAIPSRTPRVTFVSFAPSTVTALEQGERICLQDTGTNTWPKSANGPVRLPPLVPGPAFGIPRDGARLCGGAAVPAVQGEGETDGKTSLNVPGVKSIAGYGHARNQPSNRINGEKSRNAAERSQAGASSRGGHSPPPPQHQGAALCLFPVGGTPRWRLAGGWRWLLRS